MTKIHLGLKIPGAKRKNTFTMIITSLNIRGGINKGNKPHKMIEYCKNKNFDVFFIQELSHIKPKIKKMIEQQLNVEILTGPTTKQRQNIGVTCMIRKENTEKITSVTYPRIIGEGRLQHIQFKTDPNNTTYNIINRVNKGIIADPRCDTRPISFVIHNLRSLRMWVWPILFMITL
jgi:hypothetical protein